MGEYPLPTIAQGPLTLEGRQRAVEHESRDMYRRFTSKSLRTRLWSPFKLPFGEMIRLGHRLSADTATLLEGFFGVEEFIADYMLAGLNEYKRGSAYQLIQLQWGGEEWRHGAALEKCLIHSGKRTKEQIYEYNDRLMQNRWSPSQHAGVDGALGAIVYSAVQERATYLDYQRLRQRVRSEYGLPDQRTRRELRWGREIGILEALRRISIDEIAHHGIYLDLVLINLKYFPDETTEKIQQVLSGFKMPGMSLLPNRISFLRAVIRTGIDSEELQKAEVFQPFLKVVGMAA